jgi:hypothetical protein
LRSLASGAAPPARGTVKVLFAATDCWNCDSALETLATAAEGIGTSGDCSDGASGMLGELTLCGTAGSGSSCTRLADHATDGAGSTGVTTGFDDEFSVARSSACLIAAGSPNR